MVHTETTGSALEILRGISEQGGAYIGPSRSSEKVACIIDGYTVGAPEKMPSIVQGDIREHTERRGNDLLHYIWSNLDAEEQRRFMQGAMSVALKSFESGSLLPIARFFGGWEETVSLNLDLDLAQEISQAFREASRELASGDDA